MNLHSGINTTFSVLYLYHSNVLSPLQLAALTSLDIFANGFTGKLANASSDFFSSTASLMLESIEESSPPRMLKMKLLSVYPFSLVEFVEFDPLLPLASLLNLFSLMNFV